LIRVAAIGDTHVGAEGFERWRTGFADVSERADLLLLAGDLTQVGDPDEAHALVWSLERVTVPVLAVLGNHDHHSDQPERVAAVLESAGIPVLEGDAATLSFGGVRVGVAGAKGFGGGFEPACGSDFGERAMKDFIAHTRDSARRLHDALRRLEADVRIALLHYAPTRDTLRGEPPEIHAFLGSHLLGAAIDAAGADLVLHGHAHAGVEIGATAGGIRVHNVAEPVIGCAYRLFAFDGAGDAAVREVS
jgi:Icc-related predicted phosphoesterase